MSFTVRSPLWLLRARTSVVVGHGHGAVKAWTKSEEGPRSNHRAPSLMRTEPMMRVRLFGQPQFQVGDARVAFRGPARALSLVTYLLLHREQLHARAEIAFLLWPDLPESEARATLREYLRHARSALPSVDGEAWILADTRTVRWNPAAPA